MTSPAPPTGGTPIITGGSSKAWFVVLLSDPRSTTTGNVSASVQQFASAAAYSAAVGASPQQVDPAQPANGYASRAQAQAEASRFNALPADQRSAGGQPLTPSAAGPGLKNPLGAAWNAATAIPRFLSMLTNPNFWLRAGEVAAGLILLGIGVNALFKGRPMSAVTGAAGKLAPLALA